MRSNRTKGLLTRILVVVSLLFGFVAFAGTTADAQFRNRGRIVVQPRVFVYPRPFYPRAYWYNRYNRVYFPPATHVSESQGFHDGLNDGSDDARDGKSYDPTRHNIYK